MTLNDLTDFCFGGGGHEICHIFNYGGRRVRDMIENQIFLNSQKIEDAVAYLLVNCQFIVYHKSFYQIMGIPMGSDLGCLFFLAIFIFL